MFVKTVATEVAKAAALSVREELLKLRQYDPSQKPDFSPLRGLCFKEAQELVEYLVGDKFGPLSILELMQNPPTEGLQGVMSCCLEVHGLFERVHERTERGGSKDQHLPRFFRLLFAQGS